MSTEPLPVIGEVEHEAIDAEFSVAPPANNGHGNVAHPLLAHPQGESADALHDMAVKLRQTVDVAYVHLGRVLYQMFHRRSFIERGFDTFDDYVEGQLGISTHRAARCRRIWVKYVKELGIRPDHLAGVGFTAALALLPVVTRESSEEWFDRARTLSFRGLTEAVEAAQSISPHRVRQLEADGIEVKRVGPAQEDNDDLSGEGGNDSLNPRTSLPSERATTSSDRRRPPVDEDADGEARDEFATGPKTSVSPGFKTLHLRLRDDQHQVFTAAMDEVRRARPTEVSPGEAVAHVATEFLASRMTKEARPAARVEFYLTVFERVFGGKFIWVRNAAAVKVLSDAVAAHSDLFTTPTKPTATEEIT